MIERSNVAQAPAGSGEEYVGPLAVQTSELTKSFGSLTAVDRVSLTISRGSVFGLLGPNGSGKTTLIRMLLGLLAPTRGSATVLGHDIRSEAHHIRRSAGALLETGGLYDGLSASENLELWARIWALTKNERRSRIEELLDRMGLLDRRGDLVAGWSRGMKQRLLVARALLPQPQIVFLDEPTAGLDPSAARSLDADLAGLATSYGTTVVVATHRLDGAQDLCDYVGILKEGRILASGPPESLQTPGATHRVEMRGHGFTPEIRDRLMQEPSVLDAGGSERCLTLTLREQDDTSWLVRLIVENGAGIHVVTPVSWSLREAYLQLTEEKLES